MREGARIDRLRVAAHGRRGVPMVQSVVEDAFRTQLSAAGPAAQRGLLVLRRVDLGPIASRRDQGRVNRHLSSLLREMIRNAVPYDSPGAEVAPAVLFPDSLRPSLEVFRAIAFGHPVPKSWPYRAAFGQALFLPRQQRVAALLSEQLMRPEAAPAVRTLLRELGPELPAAISTLPEPFLTPLLTVLSVADTALVSPLPTSIEVVRRDLITLATAPRVATYLAQSRTPGGAEVLRRRLLIALALSEAARPVVQHRVETLERIVVSLASLSPFGSAPGRSFRQLLLECAKRLAQEVTGRSIGGKNSEDIGIESEFEALLEAMSSSGRPSAPADVDGSGDRNSIAQVADRAEEKTERRQSEPPHLPVSWEGFEPTGCAGIVYLIRLMQSVYGWLDRPEHLTRATGQRLLFRIIERLHLHPEDPVMCFLRSLGAMPDPQEIPLGFHLVPDMLPRRRARACVSSITSYPGWRMATLGRLTLAVWHGRAPPPLQKLLRSAGGIERCASRSFCDDMMISSCELGLRRLLRQGPRLSRLQLLRREGVLAATSTHLDVVFDAALIDLTIRRWALDVSPGWCLWLWRVVTIHYDFGEADAGR